MVLGTGEKLMGDMYDDWKCIDVEGQKAWNDVYIFDWTLSMVREEFPDEEDEQYLEWLAQSRIDSGYYDNTPF